LAFICLLLGNYFKMHYTGADYSKKIIFVKYLLVYFKTNYYERFIYSMDINERQRSDSVA